MSSYFATHLFSFAKNRKGIKMQSVHKAAILLAFSLLAAMPVLSFIMTPTFAKEDVSVINNYNAIKAALKAEIDEVNAQLQTAGIKTTISNLEKVVNDARTIELRYRAAVDAGKTPAECQTIAVEWGELFQPISDLQSNLTNDLGMAENQIDDKIQALQAVPSLYGKDQATIETWLKPLQTLMKLNNQAVAYITPIYEVLLTAPRGPNVTDAEVEAYFDNELVRILNSRKIAGE